MLSDYLLTYLLRTKQKYLSPILPTADYVVNHYHGKIFANFYVDNIVIIRRANTCFVPSYTCHNMLNLPLLMARVR